MGIGNCLGRVETVTSSDNSYCTWGGCRKLAEFQDMGRRGRKKSSLIVEQGWESQRAKISFDLELLNILASPLSFEWFLCNLSMICSNSRVYGLDYIDLWSAFVNCFVYQNSRIRHIQLSGKIFCNWKIVFELIGKSMVYHLWMIKVINSIGSLYLYWIVETAILLSSKKLWCRRVCWLLYKLIDSLWGS